MATRAHHFAQRAVSLRAELKAAVPRETLRALHQKSAARHFLVAGRQVALLGLATWGLLRVDDPRVFVPLVVVQGFTVFSFTVLLHEVVHHLVFARPRPRLERWLALAYALPSGLSPTQFTRWHLDHHAELGSEEDDPKRRHLSPKRNARWYKLLYCTPALFPIYFRAARREAAGYPAALRRRIAWERRLAIGGHLAVLALFAGSFGWAAAARAHLLPVFVVFPVAFTLNRLGQHYDIDPADPARWGTLMKGHWFWDFAFLNSNYHLEHHYFPGVPMYRLPALQRALAPFYARRGMRWQTYGRLLYGWFVENRAPHTDWSAAPF
jgi:fatty acid desaturase